jgi:hypothetical protein
MASVSAGHERAGSRADALHKEASVLFHYLLGREVGPHMLLLYADAVTMQTPDAGPLRLPLGTQRWPALLRLFEPIKRSDASGRVNPFKQRLRLACFIADAEEAPLFYDYRGRGLAASWRRVAALGCVELFVLPVRLVFGGLWRW